MTAQDDGTEPVQDPGVANDSRAPRDQERGDVPGWVMVTVMTAILVVAILGVFEPEIKAAIGSALTSITNGK